MSKLIGVLLNIAIDLVLASYIGRHFHDFIVGLTAYFILAGLTDIRYTVNALKEKI